MRRRRTRAARLRAAEEAYIVRRKRQAVALAGLALSPDQGEPNQPAGGGGAGSFITSGIMRQDVLVAGDVVSQIFTSSAYDPGTNVVQGSIQGVFGNNSVFGPGPYRVLISGGIRYMVGASQGSGGLR